MKSVLGHWVEFGVIKANGKVSADYTRVGIFIHYFTSMKNGLQFPGWNSFENQTKINFNPILKKVKLNKYIQ